MNRPTLLALRVLAVGSALTAITCQVVNRQQSANAAAGDRGTPGPAAGTRATRAPSSKSIDALITPADLPGAPAPKPPPVFIGGTKSAMVIAPEEARQVQQRVVPQVSPPPAATQQRAARQQ